MQRGRGSHLGQVDWKSPLARALVALVWGQIYQEQVEKQSKAFLPPLPPHHQAPAQRHCCDLVPSQIPLATGWLRLSVSMCQLFPALPGASPLPPQPSLSPGDRSSSQAPHFQFTPAK